MIPGQPVPARAILKEPTRKALRANRKSVVVLSLWHRLRTPRLWRRVFCERIPGLLQPRQMPGQSARWHEDVSEIFGRSYSRRHRRKVGSDAARFRDRYASDLLAQERHRAAR